MVAAKRTRWGAKEGYALLDQGLDLLENQARSIAAYVDFPPVDIMQVRVARSAFSPPPSVHTVKEARESHRPCGRGP